MKSIKFLMVLLFTSVMFVSCGGGVDADVERYCELTCSAGDLDPASEEGKAAQKEWEEIAAKYAEDNKDASDDDKKAFADATGKEGDKCECGKKDEEK
tara:strand:- start:526 stop:819 length:294 start_codon:yes stop_codon:yes gene_type:complete